MEWMSLNQLREEYLSFFESKGHLRLGSFSLVPQGDKSLLLINSGMAPMKKYFTGEVTPPRSRVTTCQKCIRTPDLERVGHTARHGTYFEMLGNFSFGDYFKNEAIPWAWEFLTERLGIPADLLWPSVYESDDEAYAIWRDVIGVPEEHIVKLGKEDNFWEHGTGPCGPCSEIYFDRGEKYGCGSPGCRPGCDCDRYMEIWNNVFSQFNNMGDGTYEELAQKNIDTGMGLERLACVMQGVDNMFEVDTVRKILDKVCAIAGKQYGANSDNDISIRVVTDHVRAATFMVCDGVMPSNNGRGYVLRRLLRRAARHGRLLGIDRSFLCEVMEVVIGENECAYPELREKQEFISKVISIEEESFGKTIDQGMQLLDNFIAAGSGDTLSGEDAFKLQDTYGFPIDLTVEILADRGIKVDVDGFKKIYENYRKETRAARKNAGADAWKSGAVLPPDIQPTEFVGYGSFNAEGKIIAIVKDGETVDAAVEGDSVALVLDRTCLYAESGGQVGDVGTVDCANGQVTVSDTNKTTNGIFMHIGTVSRGIIKVGDSAATAVNGETRRSTMRNHTAAHLLQAALRKVLGTHVEQAGQLVGPDSVRFDFTHFSALTADEVHQVERLVNESILAAAEVDVREMPIDEAKAMGAMALFGEKYGERVRVVNAKGYSIELCGGTHVANTAEIGLFRIVSEGSVAAGVRRIEAVTGTGVLKLIDGYTDIMSKAVATAKVGKPEELADRIAALLEENKQHQVKIEQLSAKIGSANIDSLIGGADDIAGIKVIAAKYWDSDTDGMRSVGDMVKSKYPSAVIVLSAVNGDKVTLMAAVGADAMKRGLHAGNLVREVAKICGGNGGGRPDSAMAGGKDASKVDAALASVKDLAAAQIK
ncbi:MAG: alanine--tRNA ligase [Firmicutes bacterium]|nr:alanine--tRNA ligase [Bacillota bacterium]